MTPALCGEGLRRAYGRKVVLHGVDVGALLGEIVGLIGPNGAGKSTCFRILAGAEPIDGRTSRPGGRSGSEGRVRLADEDVTHLPLEARARRGLGYLPQEPSVFRGLSARDNVVVALEAAGTVGRRRHRDEADAILEDVGLSAHARARAGVLSGGERRKLEIARLLALRPRVLLLDEPFTGLDPLASASVRRLLERLAGREMAVLLTDHNVAVALPACDRALLLLEGRIVLEGTASEVAADGRARERYLGDA